MTVSGLLCDLDRLQDSLIQLNSPVVFCHNDLLSGNIIYNPEQDDCHFIDYEYGCFSFRGFDIGNHFCEYAGFDCEWDRFPNDDYIRNWLQVYLRHSPQTNGEYPESIESMLYEVKAFSVAAHFFWAVWALVQAQVSEIDFDYFDYAVMRLAEFERRQAWLTQ